MDIKQNEFINARSRFVVPAKKKLMPPIDKAVSKIVGKNILAQDPKLYALIVKYKAGKPQNSMIPDNFMDNPDFIKELKATFQ